jgi:hypothetical protein
MHRLISAETKIASIDDPGNRPAKGVVESFDSVVELGALGERKYEEWNVE